MIEIPSTIWRGIETEKKRSLAYMCKGFRAYDKDHALYWAIKMSRQ